MSLSPGAILMFLLAVALDLLGYLCLLLDFLGIGAILSFIPDLMGLVFIGGWMYLVKGESIKLTGKATRWLGTTAFGEAAPLLGDLLPGWTLLVILEMLKDQHD